MYALVLEDKLHGMANDNIQRWRATSGKAGTQAVWARYVTSVGGVQRRHGRKYIRIFVALPRNVIGRVGICTQSQPAIIIKT